MWCEFPPEDLSALLDGQLPDARVRETEEHLRTCPACRTEAGRLERADEAVRGRPSHPVPASLRERVASAARRAGRAARRRWAARWSAAAAVVLGAAVAFLGSRGDPAPRVPEQVARQATLLDSLELDAASLRLLLAAEESASSVEPGLAARLDDVLRRIRELRREGLSPERQGG